MICPVDRTTAQPTTSGTLKLSCSYEVGLDDLGSWRWPSCMSQYIFSLVSTLIKPICLTRHGAYLSSASKYRHGTMGSETTETTLHVLHAKHKFGQDYLQTASYRHVWNPSLGACNYSTFLSLRFHRPVYFLV